MEEKKRGKGILIVTVVVILVAAIIGVYLYISNNKKESLGSVTVDGYSLNQEFDPDIYEYEITVKENKVKISCDSTGKIEGCNEEIDLTDKEEYAHKIKVDGKEYTIKIKKNLDYTIKTVSGNPTQWTNKDITLTVEMTYVDSGYEYSFDGGETWVKNNKYVVKENGKYNIQVKIGEKVVGSKEVEVTKIDKTIPKVSIKKGEVKDNKLKLEIEGKDDESGVLSISFNGGTYGSAKEYTVEKAGKYYAQVKDRAGNISEKAEVEIAEEELKGTQSSTGNNTNNNTNNNNNNNNNNNTNNTNNNNNNNNSNNNNSEEGENSSSSEKESEKSSVVNTYTLYLKGNSSGLADTSVTCTTNGEKCSVTIPEKNVEKGTIIGWSAKASDRYGEYKAGDEILLTKDITLYAISKREYVVTFDVNTAKNVKTKEIKCEAYNGGTCNVVAPEIEAKEYEEALGWGINKEKVEYEEDETIIVTKDITLYAITRALPEKTYTVTLNSNGAVLSTTTSPTCTTNRGSCEVTLPTIVEKEEYEVIGWGETSNSVVAKYASGATITIDKDIKLYAIIKEKATEEEKTYTVTIDANGAEVTSTKITCTTTSGSCSVKLPAITTNNGGEVIGYATSKDATEKEYASGATITINKDTKLYAITKKRYKATFDANGASHIGSEEESCEAYNGGSCTVTAPSITAIGKIVVGWSTSKDATDTSIKSGNSITLTEDTTYYAIVKENTIIPEVRYEVTLHGNGASLTGNKVDCVVENGSCSVTLPEIVQPENGQVVGYSTNSEAIEAEYESGATITINGNMDLYAITKKKYRVTFDKNYADGVEKEYEECYAYNGNKCRVKASKIIVSNGEGLGWSAGENDTRVIFEEEELIDVDRDIKLYAVIKVPYKATFEVNGAQEIGATEVSCDSINYGSCEITAPTITAKATGEVIGWSTNKNAKTTTIKAGGKITLNGPAKYYAITKNTYKATFNKNKAESVGKSSESCEAYNLESCSVETPSITPKSGQEVIGWSTSKDATATNIKVGNTVILTKNTTYYAITKESEVPQSNYKVTIIDAGSWMETSEVSCEEPGSCSLTLPEIVPLVDGGIILGYAEVEGATDDTAWSLDETVEDKIKYQSGQTITVDKDMTLLATVKYNNKVTFYGQNTKTIEGQNVKSKTYECTSYGRNHCIVTPPTATVESGTFLGWDRDNEYEGEYPDYMSGKKVELSDGDEKELYAITKDIYTLTFNSNGAQAISSTSETCTAYNGKKCKISKIPTITAKPTGQVIGWGTKDSATTSVLTPGETNVEVNGSATYYAVTKNTYTVTFNKNNAASVSKQSDSCVAYNKNSCSVEKPTVTLKTNTSELVGWSTDKDAESAQILPTGDISFSGNLTVYAITKDIYTATFDKNKASSVGKPTLTCVSFNGKNCEVTMPSITPTSRALGYSKNKDATEAEYQVGQNVSIDGNTTFYAIINNDVGVEYWMTFIGPDYEQISQVSCIPGDNGKCSVTPPQYSYEDWELLGWSDDLNATTAEYDTTSDIEISESSVLYTILGKTLTATFDHSKLNGQVQTPQQLTCKVYYTLNNKGCSITLPRFNVEGSFSSFWSTDPIAMSDLYQVYGTTNKSEYFNESDAEYRITENTTFYPNTNSKYYYCYQNENCYKDKNGNVYDSYYDHYGRTNRYRAINTANSFRIANTLFECESGIPQSACSNLGTAMNKAYASMPYLFTPTKVFVMKEGTYNSYSFAYGLTHNFSRYNTVDLKYDTSGMSSENTPANSVSINAALHELAHTWDRYYKTMTGTDDINAQSDFNAFYNSISSKLYADQKGNKISKTETFAGMTTNYYWHFIDKTGHFEGYALKDGVSLSSSEWAQLKTIIEKYANISVHGYVSD